MKYLVVYERSGNGYSAFVPDLPGCIAAGETRDEVEKLIREAVEIHLEGMREHAEPIPEPGAWGDIVEVPAVA